MVLLRHVNSIPLSVLLLPIPFTPAILVCNPRTLRALPLLSILNLLLKLLLLQHLSPPHLLLILPALPPQLPLQLLHPSPLLLPSHLPAPRPQNQNRNQNFLPRLLLPLILLAPLSLLLPFPLLLMQFGWPPVQLLHPKSSLLPRLR